MLRMTGHWQPDRMWRGLSTGWHHDVMAIRVPVRYWKKVCFVRVERLGIFQKALLMLLFT
eukprot:566129-Pelagomonas_calceolata.AAC.1